MKTRLHLIRLNFQLPLLANSKKFNKEKFYEALDVFVSSVVGGSFTVIFFFYRKKLDYL